jgi:hypothetical protein
VKLNSRSGPRCGAADPADLAVDHEHLAVIGLADFVVAPIDRPTMRLSRSSGIALFTTISPGARELLARLGGAARPEPMYRR